MVHIQKWSEFRIAVRELLTSSPQNTRYQIKVRKCRGSSILKATNNDVCVKYRARHDSEARKVERLTSVMLKLMTMSKADLMASRDEDDGTTTGAGPSAATGGKTTKKKRGPSRRG